MKSATDTRQVDSTGLLQPNFLMENNEEHQTLHRPNRQALRSIRKTDNMYPNGQPTAPRDSSTIRIQQITENSTPIEKTKRVL